MKIQQIEWHNGGNNPKYITYLNRFRGIRPQLRKLIERHLTQIQELFKIIHLWMEKDGCISITLDLGCPEDCEDEPPYEIELFSYEKDELSGDLKCMGSPNFPLAQVEFNEEQVKNG